MRISIEDWIEQQNITYEAKELMQEAILCYKAGAHRASLLFSYLSFQTTIKERILISRKPDDYPDSKWNDIIMKLSNEDKWDPTVYDAIQTKQPSEIFPITEDLRTQVTYWKDRRNDCAHAKRNLISSSHVESFWFFFQSNVDRFYIVGGIAALIEKIRDHFDTSITPPDSDFSHLIRDIPLVVSPDNFDGFLEQLYNVLNHKASLVTANKDVLNFFLALFDLPSPLLENYVSYLIENQEPLCIELLRQDPGKATYFRDKAAFIRKLWHNKFNSYKDFKLFIGLLRKQIIPETQIPEAIRCFLSRYTQITYNDLPDGGDFIILRDLGFFKQLKEIAFKHSQINSFDWANARKELVVYYIKTFGLDEEVVRSLNSTFRSDDHPWHLKSSLIELFRENEKLSKEYLDICEIIEERPAKHLGF